MVVLSEKEVEILSNEIESNGLTYTELQNELLDHLCCDVEVKMAEGIEFIAALDEVKRAMDSDCIKQIQEDTLLLVNQKYRMMKKFMYTLGMIAPGLVIIGTIFKVMHWPAASILLSLGLFLLAVVYLPVFVSVRIRDTRKQGKSVNMRMYIIGVASGIVFIMGALFKILHWPGAGTMITLSGLVSVLVFIPMLVLNAMRDKENQVQNFTILIFVMSFIAISFMTFSLQVSKDALSSFSIAVDDNIRTEEVLDRNNSTLRKSLAYMNMSADKKVKIEEVIRKTDEMIHYIDKVIYTIVTESHPRNIEAVSEYGVIDFEEVMNKSNHDVPAIIMLGIDRDVAEGVVIKRMLEEYKVLASQLLGKTDGGIEKALDTSDKITYEEPYRLWETYNFEHVPMMSAICQLSSIKVNSRVVEGRLLRQVLLESSQISMIE